VKQENYPPPGRESNRDGSRNEKFEKGARKGRKGKRYQKKRREWVELGKKCGYDGRTGSLRNRRNEVIMFLDGWGLLSQKWDIRERKRKNPHKGKKRFHLNSTPTASCKGKRNLRASNQQEISLANVIGEEREGGRAAGPSCGSPQQDARPKNLKAPIVPVDE